MLRSNVMNMDPGTLPETVRKVCAYINRHGGRAWLVGGAVRDLCLGWRVRDLDLEVFGLPLQELLRILRDLGSCSQVGRRFGVIKLRIDGCEIDVSLPRRERKRGSGHRGFDVQVDPMLPVEIASQRRDFTINAMMFDPLDGTLLDFHGGRSDLRAACLRHVSSAFSEDPLRPLRAMQFAARLDFRLHPDTALLCRALLSEAESLPRERIWQEWHKWSQADAPDAGLRCLWDSGWIALYPCLRQMRGCPQDPVWHPEGDVWRHTLLVLRQAARIASERGLDADTRASLLFSALLHDVGKPSTTFHDANGRIRSSGHAEAAVPLVRTFLRRIGAPKSLFEHVIPLVREHLVHLHGKPTERAVRRLSHRLHPVHIEQWERLVEADASGREPLPKARPAISWLRVAERMRVSNGKPKPLVDGHMLMRMGIAPGVEMGRLLRKAYEAQLDACFDSKEAAERWCRRHLIEA